MAVWSANRQTKGVVSHHCNTLVQIVANSFDGNMSSIIGLKQTYSLAMMVLQQDQIDTYHFELEIPRLKKQDMKCVDLPDFQQVVYIEPKTPPMPNNDSF